MRRPSITSTSSDRKRCHASPRGRLAFAESYDDLDLTNGSPLHVHSSSLQGSISVVSGDQPFNVLVTDNVPAVLKRQNSDSNDSDGETLYLPYSRRSSVAVPQKLTSTGITAGDEHRTPGLRRFRQLVYKQIQANRMVSIFDRRNSLSGIVDRVTRGRQARDRFLYLDCALLLLSFFVTLIHVFLVPYRICLERYPSKGWMSFELVLESIQIALVAVNFVRPYDQNGIRITRLELVAWHYFRSYFLLDAICAFPTSAITWGVVNGDGLALLNKIFPVTLYIRWKHVMEDSIVTRVVSPFNLRVVRQLLAFFTVVHLSSCSWYLVLLHGEDDATTFGALASWSKGFFDSQPKITLYLRGVDWSLKHLCGYGVQKSFPQTDEQVLFMLGVAMVGIAMYAYFLASVSSFVGHLAESNALARFRTKLDEVTGCLNSHPNLPQEFKEEVRNYYKHVFKAAGTIGVSSILDDLDPVLLDKVNFEVGKAILSKVPIFAPIQCPALVDSLMTNFTPKVFLPNIEIITVGQRGMEMFFVHSGELRVVDGEGDTVDILQPGDHFGEEALLMPVRRALSVVTNTVSTVFVLTKQAFEECLSQYPDLMDIIQNHVVAKLKAQLEKAGEEGKACVTAQAKPNVAKFGGEAGSYITHFMAHSETSRNTSFANTRRCSSGGDSDVVFSEHLHNNESRVGGFLFSPKLCASPSKHSLSSSSLLSPSVGRPSTVSSASSLSSHNLQAFLPSPDKSNLPTPQTPSINVAPVRSKSIRRKHKPAPPLEIESNTLDDNDGLLRVASDRRRNSLVELVEGSETPKADQNRRKTRKDRTPVFKELEDYSSQDRGHRNTIVSVTDTNSTASSVLDVRRDSRASTCSVYSEPMPGVPRPSNATQG